MNDEYRELWNKVYIKITTLQKNEDLPIEEKNVTAENQKYNFLRAYQMLGLSDHAADNMSGHGLKFWGGLIKFYRSVEVKRALRIP